MKNTSYSYGLDYQLKQTIKHRNRKNNHWKKRIEILNYLIDNYTLPKLLHHKVLEEIIS